jgi:short-subunit dehydrogenase involved in D-alanine esterification of teichoic acids
VTGGSRGIGLGIAEAFYRANSQVILCGRDDEKLSAVESQYPGITAISCDLGDAQQRRALAAIINASSRLGFVPLLKTPIYSATKAALHTYTLLLRAQLKDTAIKVIEVVPPMVDTGLNKTERDRTETSLLANTGNRQRGST